MKKERLLETAKPGDYVAIMRRDKVLEVTQVGRVTPRQIITHGGYHFWKTFGRRVDCLNNDCIQFTTKAKYDAWMQAQRQKKADAEKDALIQRAVSLQEENKILSNMGAEIEFQRQRLASLPIWRLRIAYAALMWPQNATLMPEDILGAKDYVIVGDISKLL